ncbi:hypothetical protein [Synechococcus elongatus]|uniref:hypothetical protein n=1 Tax=Synechococcus elongatus TaxID=32046 RepID=UPI001374EA07|nr:hypothetical protein [Synechococcus elongatus]
MGIAIAILTSTLGALWILSQQDPDLYGFGSLLYGGAALFWILFVWLIYFILH